MINPNHFIKINIYPKPKLKLKQQSMRTLYAKYADTLSKVSAYFLCQLQTILNEVFASR